LKKVGACVIILEKIIIISLVFFLGQPKNFSHHPMVWVCQMAIEIFWLPSNTPS
jgi:hypothetical protein